MHAPVQWLSLYRKYGIPFLEIAHQGIDLAIQSGEHRVVDPGLLHKFELTLNIAIEANEVQTTVCAVIDHDIFQAMAIRTATSQDAVTVRRVQSGRRIRAERITRIGAADVGSDWASDAVRIFAVVAEVVFVLQRGIILLGTE